MSIISNRTFAYQSSAPVFLCKLLTCNVLRKEMANSFLLLFCLIQKWLLISQDFTVVALFSSLLERAERWWRNTSFKFINYAPFNHFPRHTSALRGLSNQIQNHSDFVQAVELFLASLANSSAFTCVGKEMYSFQMIGFHIFSKIFLVRRRQDWSGSFFLCKGNKMTYSFIIRLFLKKDK